MEGVLPIRGVDGSTGEAIPIDAAPSLREVDDLFRANVVRWAALDVPSIMIEEDLTKLREAYRIPTDIELMLPGPNERACFLRRGCTALHLNAFVSGMILPLHPMFLRILRAYGLAPTQTIYQPKKLPKKKGREEETGVRVVDDPEPDLDVSNFYGIAVSRSRRNVSGETSTTNARSFNEAEAQGSGTRLRRRYLVEEGSSQPKKKTVELVDNYAVCTPQPLQRTLSVNPSGEVVLDSPPRVDPVSGGPGVGPFDSKKKLGELIGPLGSRISNDTLKNVPFFPSIGAQAVKKYFTPKWEEFASHGELEDVLEAGLVAAVRTTSL
ncbi:hypothetical protein Adt_15341 [Abeliophyllum distichum]|uniref:Uncharacterized protein n=1 Tax=Abeliophyllum distichum TaxID=126358 RepID=A0ABD1U295_9LAMI